jgi:uncharacterized protein YndB with AHSA1/START domain
MDEYGVATDKTTVHMQKLLPASVDVVWEYLTQSDKRATWLASGDMGLHIGGQADLCFNFKNTWNEREGRSSEVRFELKAQGDKTLLTLTHSRLPDRNEMVSVSSGWHIHLGILEDRLNQQQPRPFWATHARLEAEYKQRIPG